MFRRVFITQLTINRCLSSRPPVKKDSSGQKITILTLKQKYRRDEPITMLTAHDYPSARYCEKAGVDIVLVGDSLAMVGLGHDSTLPVTMDEMLHHCRAVARGSKLPFLVGDLPFGSYQESVQMAVRNAVRFVKDGNMDAVKLEGGIQSAEKIKAIVDNGIPVVGHIGLTPQSISSLGGYRVQGKTFKKAKALVEDAKALEEAGCFMIVLEAMPEVVATLITKSLSIPTIGIGAGNQCSGQVLVQHDMLGSFDKFIPRFCKQYANLNDLVTEAIKQYVSDVKSRSFPAHQHTYPMDEEEKKLFEQYIDEIKCRK